MRNSPLQFFANDGFFDTLFFLKGDFQHSKGFEGLTFVRGEIAQHGSIGMLQGLVGGVQMLFEGIDLGGITRMASHTIRCLTER
jgi:hypothetical protein